MAARRLCLVLLAWAMAVAAPPPPPRSTRTYRFKAKITLSQVQPLKVGDYVVGSFTYDLNGKMDPATGALLSPRNALSMRVRELRFAGKNVRAGAGHNDHSEAFIVGAYSMTFPKGWDSPTPSCGIMLYNEPSRNALPRKGLPERLSLADFKTREFALYFQKGVTFPGGESVTGATVKATIEKLE